MLSYANELWKADLSRLLNDDKITGSGMILSVVGVSWSLSSFYSYGPKDCRFTTTFTSFPRITIQHFLMFSRNMYW